MNLNIDHTGELSGFQCEVPSSLPFSEPGRVFPVMKVWADRCISRSNAHTMTVGGCRALCVWHPGPRTKYERRLESNGRGKKED